MNRATVPAAQAGLPFVVTPAQNREHSQGKPGQRLRASFPFSPLSLPATSPAFPLARSRLFPVALPACFLALPLIILALSLVFLPRPMAGSSVSGQQRWLSCRSRDHCFLLSSGQIRA